MSLATSTLASAITVNDTNIVVASATGAVAGGFALIDQEMMMIAQNYSSGTTIPVLRGKQGSVTAAHVKTANVTFGTGADFAGPGATRSVTYALARIRTLTSITTTPATLTLPPAGQDATVILNGTSAIALTVPVPTKDKDGDLLYIASNGAAAHTVTFTGGLGGAGTSYDVITTNATAPVLYGPFMAVNGLWQVAVTAAMSGTVTNLIGGIA